MNREENVEDKLICLVLNNAWQPIGQKTVKEAICALVAGDFLAIDVGYFDSSGVFDFSKPKEMNPLSWEDWLNLPVRSFDFFIRSPKLIVRVPTVIISKSYSKMPVKRMKLSAENVRLRDRNICQYSGKKISNTEGSVDHIIPKSSGGGKSWDNLVFCDKKINLKKSNKNLAESGLKLLKQPQEPPTTPVFMLLREARHRDWNHFIIS
jgi:5-methylcytosine-specific restriction endonuclease McrA